MAFDPDAFLKTPVDPAPPSSGEFNPDKFLSEDNTPPFDPDAFLAASTAPTAKDIYIANRQKLQQMPLLQKAGEFVADLPEAAYNTIGGLTQAIPTAIKTIGQAFEPNQTGTNARQDILDAGLTNAADVSQAFDTGLPRFLNAITGKQLTPEELGQQYDQEQAYQATRNKIQNLGANPAISQNLQAQGGLGSILGQISAPGTAQVNSERQNQIEPLVDPTMYIPFGAAGGGIRAGLTKLGLETAREAAPGLTATLAGKAIGGIGKGLQTASGAKDALNASLQKVVQGVTGNDKLAELAGHSGTEAAIGLASKALGMGEGGALAGFLAPQALKQAGDATASAGKILQEGRGTVPFFERMAQEAVAQGNPLASNVYRLMDSTGVGGLLEKSATGVKDAVKATAFSAPYQLPLAGDDPEQAANTVAGNLGFGLAGAGLHAFHPIDSASLQAMHDLDVAAVRKTNPEIDQMAASQASQAAARALIKNPNLTQDQAENIGANYARQTLGSVASIIRTNPDVVWHLEPGDISDGNRQWVDKDGKSHIALNMDSKSILQQATGHELIHHIQSAGTRNEILSDLLGDPETKENGYLRTHNADGTVTDDPNWLHFRQQYNKALGNTGAQPNNTGKVSVSDRKAAEEYLAEIAGSVLAGRTSTGELNYNRIRRSGASDKILEKVLGPNSRMRLDPLQSEFLPEGFDSLKWLNDHPDIKDRVFDYLKDKDYLNHTDKTEFSDEFSTRSDTLERMNADPKRFFKKYGNDASLVWSFDKAGEPSAVRVAKKKEEESTAAAQANELFEKLKADPTKFQIVTRADGGKEIRFRDLDDTMLGSLRHLNSMHKDNLIQLNDIVNKMPGTVLRFTYQPAITGKGKYAARETGIYEGIPYDIFISQPGGAKSSPNILTHILNLDQMIKNQRMIQGLMTKASLPVDPRYNDAEWFRSSLAKMAKAHQEGRKSTDGTGISDADRDFLNLAMGIQPVGKEGINLLGDTLNEKLGTMAKIPSAIRSFRLDRINRMSPSEAWGNIPFQYPASKFNKRPEVSENVLNRPEPAGAGETGAEDYLKNNDYVFNALRPIVDKAVDQGQKLFRGTKDKAQWLDRMAVKAEKGINSLVDGSANFLPMLYDALKGGVARLSGKDAEAERARLTDDFLHDVRSGKDAGKFVAEETENGVEVNPVAPVKEDKPESNIEPHESFDIDPREALKATAETERVAKLIAEAKKTGQSRFVFNDETGRAAQVYLKPDNTATVRIPGHNMFEEAASTHDNVRNAVGDLVDKGFTFQGATLEKKISRAAKVGRAENLIKAGMALGQTRFHFNHDDGRMAALISRKDGKYSITGISTNRQFASPESAIKFMHDKGFNLMSSGLEKKLTKKGAHPDQNAPPREREAMFRPEIDRQNPAQGLNSNYENNGDSGAEASQLNGLGANLGGGQQGREGGGSGNDGTNAGRAVSTNPEKLGPLSPQNALRAIESHGLTPIERDENGGLKRASKDRHDTDLIGAARRAGLYINPKKANVDYRKGDDLGGAEHEVYNHSGTDGRLYKITRPGKFGISADGNEYLQRLANAEELWPDLGYKIHGVTIKEGFPQFIHSMKAIEGEHPTEPEMQQWMKDQGWIPIPGRFNAWKDSKSGAIMYDAHEGNFIKRPDGSMVPIDSDVRIPNTETASIPK